MSSNRVLALSLMVVLVAGSAAWSFVGDDQVGKTAPDFALKDVRGKKYKLSDFSGRIVVLEWANKDCPVWVKALDRLNGTYKQYVDQDIVWLNVDSTNYMNPEDVHKYMVKNDVTKIWLDDRDGKTGKAYGARTTPHMFIVGKDGKVAYDGAIDNQKNGDENVNYVAAALDELIAGKAVSTPRTNPYGCSVKYKK